MSAGRLLIVDDDVMNLEIIRRRLSRQGFDVLVSSNGRHALERVQQSDVDLVLLDIEMPELSGFDLLRRVRADHSASELPIIIVSGRQDSDAVVEALGLGANDYVTKPIDLAVTCARINTQLERRSERSKSRTHRVSGLPNRAGLDHWWRHRVDRDSPVALLTLNLDRFSVVNSGLGREIGDQVLTDVGRRLRGLVPAGAFIGHLHADEFVVILENESEERAMEVASTLLREISEPVAPPVVPVALTGSVGLSRGDGCRSLDELLGEADSALYRAKTQSGNCAVAYRSEHQSRAAERLKMETELRDVVACHAMRLEFQPIVTLADGAVSAFEALARWRHPTRGEVPPAAFIPLAEETGLILTLGQQVFQLACRQLREWQQTGLLPPGGSLAINISATQLRDPAWLETVQAIIAETGVDPAGIKLEITEGILLEDLDYARNLFVKLGDLGVKIALDDFGTGHSSLNYLQHLAVDWIKIDRSFVHQLTSVSRKKRIVQSVLELSGRLGISVVAEGIELASDYRWLRMMDCRFGQGYYISKPLPPAEATAFASQRMGPLRSESTPRRIGDPIPHTG